MTRLTMVKNIVFAVLFVGVVCSCSSGDDVEQIDNPAYSATPIELDIPAFFKESIIDPVIPVSNPLTEEGVALGKKLFFDPILSADRTISCADCHPPLTSFSDTDQFSEGVQGRMGNRNAMPLFNLAWNFDERFFWDALPLV